MVLTSLGRSPDPRHDPLFEQIGGPPNWIAGPGSSRRLRRALLRSRRAYVLLSTDCAVKRRLCCEIVYLS